MSKLYYFFALVSIGTMMVWVQASSCAASPTNCPENSCSITNATGEGGTQCFSEANYAECESYDDDGHTIDKNTTGCNTSGGMDFPSDPDCQIYWWTCDPWAV